MLRPWLRIILRAAGPVWLGVVALQICFFCLGRRVNRLVLVFVCTEAPVAIHLLYLLLCQCCCGPLLGRCPRVDHGCLGIAYSCVASLLPGKPQLEHRPIARGQTHKAPVSLHALADLLVLVAIACVNMRVLSYNSAWCCQRPWLTEEMCALVRRVSDTLANQNVTHWLCHGSLLGAARSGNPLGWDHDTDLCILGDVAKAGQALSRAGFRVEFHPESGMTPARVLMPGTDWSTLADIWVDLHQVAAFKLRDVPGEELLSSPDTVIGDRKRNHTPAGRGDAEIVMSGLRRNMPLYSSQTFPLARLPYCGHMLPVPKDYEKALEEKFGKDWRVPVEPVGVQGWACRLWTDSDPWLGLR